MIHLIKIPKQAGVHEIVHLIKIPKQPVFMK